MNYYYIWSTFLYHMHAKCNPCSMLKMCLWDGTNNSSRKAEEVLGMPKSQSWKKGEIPADWMSEMEKECRGRGKERNQELKWRRTASEMQNVESSLQKKQREERSTEELKHPSTQDPDQDPEQYPQPGSSRLEQWAVNSVRKWLLDSFILERVGK